MSVKATVSTLYGFTIYDKEEALHASSMTVWTSGAKFLTASNESNRVFSCSGVMLLGMLPKNTLLSTELAIARPMAPPDCGQCQHLRARII